MRILAITLLALVYSPISRSAILPPTFDVQIRVYEEKVKVLDQILLSECPTQDRFRRDVPNDDQTLEVLKMVYDQLFAKLAKCRGVSVWSKSDDGKIISLPTIPAAIQREQPSSTTNKPRDTTETTKVNIIMPDVNPCLTAKRFTESWRLDHIGSDYKAGGPHSYLNYACDFHKDTQWFRFGGSAGSRLLNTCPMDFSCGAFYPYWTDEPMPELTGVPITINVFGVYKGDCKHLTTRLHVLRCPGKRDFEYVYKLEQPYEDDVCGEAFCGMD